MARQRRRSIDWAVYWLVRLVVCVVQALPVYAALAAADGIAWLMYYLVPSRRRIALANVAAAFPDWSTIRQRRLVLDTYRHFVRAVTENVLLARKLHVHNWRSYVDISQARCLPEVLLDRRAVLLVTGHFGNWEVGGYVPGLLGFHTYAIARTLDNPYLERLVRRLRQSSGQTLIAKKDEFDRLTAALTSGGKVATLADQDAGPRGVFVPFFGRPASTHKAVALMALEFDALILVVGVPRVPRMQGCFGRPDRAMESISYAVIIEEVIEPRHYAGHPDAVMQITQRYTAALERLIRRHPAQYFWVHRRWKHQPKAVTTRKIRQVA
ncbi:MAG: lysophospholipid acyltransferase family protein [Gemmataceae bacterium]|nr:lysophospholipid acyltransferase family protein [Gemmataceae bacterium]MDW8242899.1 lysophospholipid acyltransferase family protein [Thermogemmata sp.]